MPEGPIKAIITPIFKSDDKSDPANYRPVSLTNHLTKIFERVLRKHLVEHLESQDLMNSSQHGFRDKHSTISQLLAYYDSILSMMEEGHYVHSVYLDFAKAFDKVDHNILLQKIKGCGIQGKILEWLTTFLRTRTQQVRVGAHLSKEVRVKSGVPQGSVLGPLLFLIYMIDITDGLEGIETGSFADDTKNWQTTTFTFFQRELDKMYQWARDNNSVFNGKKFVKITYGNPDDNTVLLTPEGQPISCKKHVKDLGVYMSADTTFDYHINNVIKGAQKMSAWVLRTFKTRQVGPMLTLLKSLVRSKAEYASILWSPTDSKNIQKLEGIQRRFTEKIGIFRKFNERTGLTECKTDYAERLRRLKLYSLQRRRERYMICYMYQLHLGIVPDLGFLSDTGRNGPKYFAKFNNGASEEVQSVRYSSFFTQGPVLFNLLPADFRTIEKRPDTKEEAKKMKESFKKKLDKWLELVPDIPVTGNPNRKSADLNALECRMRQHGKEVNRQWTIVRRRIEAEEARNTACGNINGDRDNNTCADNQV